MKRILIMILLIIITFGNFIDVYAVTVGQNGDGSNNSAPGGGDGRDDCPVYKQYCERGRYVEAVAYRLTFVYAKDEGTKFYLAPNANDPTKPTDSLDFWATDNGFDDTEALKNYGSRSRWQASKIEYINGVNLWRIGNRNNSSTYKEGVHYVHDSGLNKFLGKDGYNGKKVMEYFSGTEATKYAKLLALAKRMNVIKSDASLEDLGSISIDSEGYFLKLLIEPISYYMMGTGGGKDTDTGGFFTATEIAMILKGKVGGYSVRTNDGNRATCIFPLRGYLTIDDNDLGFDAYTGSFKCNKSLGADNIFKNLGVMVVDLSDLPRKECKVVFRTIALSNPFPGHDGNSRVPGDNWYTPDNSLVEDYILNNRNTSADTVYKLNPMYRITLTPVLIKQIRSYNSRIVDGYNDNSLTNCDEDGGNCQSTFIRNNYKSSFSGCAFDGTC